MRRGKGRAGGRAESRHPRCGTQCRRLGGSRPESRWRVDILMMMRDIREGWSREGGLEVASGELGAEGGRRAVGMSACCLLQLMSR